MSMGGPARRTTSVLLAAVLFVLAGCGSGEASAQKIADRVYPGLLTVVDTTSGTVPGGFFPETTVTFGLADDPDAVVVVAGPNEARLRAAVTKARWEAAELRALRSVLTEQDLPLVGMDLPEPRAAGVEVRVVIAVTLEESTLDDVRRRLDAAFRAWPQARQAGGLPAGISSLALGLIAPERVAEIPQASNHRLPVLGQLSYPPRLSASTAAQSASVFTTPRGDGSLWSVDASLNRTLAEAESQRIDERAAGHARKWAASAGLDRQPATQSGFSRLEPGRFDRLRTYVLLCPPSAGTCNTQTTDRAVGMTLDLRTLEATEVGLVTATRRPGGGWVTPLEPERFE